MNTAKQIGTFISYSRKDKEFALELAKELKSAGCLVWLDQLDIPTGGRWDDEVEMALRECEIFLIILTPASVSSENVKDEIGYAIDHGKRIMPVLLEECNVPLRLRRFQYVDFTKMEFSEGIKRAKQLLDALLNERSTPVLTIKPVLEPQKALNRKAKLTRPLPNKNKPIQRRWVGVGAGILALATCLGVLGVTIILKDFIFPPTSSLPLTNAPTAVPTTAVLPTTVPTTVMPPPAVSPTAVSPTAVPPTYTPIPPAKLRLSDPLFTTLSPLAGADKVILKVNITNIGGLDSNSFSISWQPDPSDNTVFTINEPPLRSGQTISVSFPSYVYKHSGLIHNSINLDTGDEGLVIELKVLGLSLNYNLVQQVKGGGGNGGVPMSLDCPEEAVVTGFFGRSGNLIDQIGIRCSRLASDGTLGNSMEIGPVGGDGGGPFNPINCPPGQVLFGIKGVYDWAFSQFSGLCISLIENDTYETDLLGIETRGIEFESICPTNYVVTGIYGRYGDLVDQINITCTAIEKK